MDIVYTYSVLSVLATPFDVRFVLRVGDRRVHPISLCSVRRLFSNTFSATAGHRGRAFTRNALKISPWDSYGNRSHTHTHTPGYCGAPAKLPRPVSYSTTIHLTYRSHTASSLVASDRFHCQTCRFACFDERRRSESSAHRRP